MVYIGGRWDFVWCILIPCILYLIVREQFIWPFQFCQQFG